MLFFLHTKQLQTNFAKDRNNLLRALNEAMLSGTPKVSERTGKVIFGEIDKAKKKIVDELLDKAQAKPEIRTAIYNNLDSIRINGVICLVHRW